MKTTEIKKIFSAALGSLNLTEMAKEQILERTERFKSDLRELIFKTSIADQSISMPIIEMEIKIPTDYNHKNFLRDFIEKNDPNLYINNETQKYLTDDIVNIDQLALGETYIVKFYRTIEETRGGLFPKFLDQQGSIKCGALGLIFLYQQNKEKLLSLFEEKANSLISLEKEAIPLSKTKGFDMRFIEQVDSEIKVHNLLRIWPKDSFILSFHLKNRR